MSRPAEVCQRTRSSEVRKAATAKRTSVTKATTVMVSMGRKKVARKKRMTAEMRPPERDGAAAGVGEGAELQRGEDGDDAGDEGDHPKPAEEEQGHDECDEDDSSEDALHVTC